MQPYLHLRNMSRAIRQKSPASYPKYQNAGTTEAQPQLLVCSLSRGPQDPLYKEAVSPQWMTRLLSKPLKSEARQSPWIK